MIAAVSNKPPSFQEKQALKETCIIYLHRALADMPEGKQPIYLYIAVRGDNIARYNDVVENPASTYKDVERCGKIIASGYGLNPPPDVKYFMEVEYGFVHEEDLEEGDAHLKGLWTSQAG